jgi:hypothetical protein
MKFTVPVVLTVSGYTTVETETLSDAKAIAKMLNETGVDLGEIEDPSFESECMIDEVAAVLPQMQGIMAEDVNEQLSHCELDLCGRASNGQLIYRSNIFEWTDGTFRNCPDPTYNDE